MDDEIAKGWLNSVRRFDVIEAGTMSGYALYYKALDQALQSQGQTICKIKPIKPIDTCTEDMCIVLRDKRILLLTHEVNICEYYILYYPMSL